MLRSGVRVGRRVMLARDCAGERRSAEGKVRLLARRVVWQALDRESRLWGKSLDYVVGLLDAGCIVTQGHKLARQDAKERKGGAVVVVCHRWHKHLAFHDGNPSRLHHAAAAAAAVKRSCTFRPSTCRLTCRCARVPPIAAGGAARRSTCQDLRAEDARGVFVHSFSPWHLLPSLRCCRACRRVCSQCFASSTLGFIFFAQGWLTSVGYCSLADLVLPKLAGAGQAGAGGCRARGGSGGRSRGGGARKVRAATITITITITSASGTSIPFRCAGSVGAHVGPCSSPEMHAVAGGPLQCTGG